LARVTTRRSPAKSCTAPFVRISIVRSLMAGSMCGAAARSAVPSSSLSATRYVTVIGKLCALVTMNRLPQTYVRLIGASSPMSRAGPLVRAGEYREHQHAAQQRDRSPGGDRRAAVPHGAPRSAREHMLSGAG
jgi:hypothetical protein